jgi:hypothetical protein
MGETALKLVETEPVEQKALTIVDQAKAVKVVTAEDYTAAGALWKQIGDMIKEVKDTFDPICDAAHKAHTAATQKRSKYLDPLTAAYKSVKGLMSAWDGEQTRIRKAEEARLEALRRAEEEKRRNEELARLEAERKAEEERLLEAAMAAELAGDNTTAEALTLAAVQTTAEAKQEAAAIQAEPVYVAPVVLPKATPKLQGGPIYKTIWKYRITDPLMIPRQYLIPDEKTIGAVVRSSQGRVNIPGVQPYEERC